MATTPADTGIITTTGITATMAVGGQAGTGIGLVTMVTAATGTTGMLVMAGIMTTGATPTVGTGIQAAMQTAGSGTTICTETVRNGPGSPTPAITSHEYQTDVTTTPGRSIIQAPAVSGNRIIPV